MYIQYVLDQVCLRACGLVESLALMSVNMVDVI